MNKIHIGSQFDRTRLMLLPFSLPLELYLLGPKQNANLFKKI